jgi:chromosome segregation ATPase
MPTELDIEQLRRKIRKIEDEQLVIRERMGQIETAKANALAELAKLGFKTVTEAEKALNSLQDEIGQGLSTIEAQLSGKAIEEAKHPPETKQQEQRKGYNPPPVENVVKPPAPPVAPKAEDDELGSILDSL